MNDNEYGRNIYYGNVFYSNARKVYDGRFADLKLCLRNICHQAIFYPKNVFKDFCFDTNYKLLADYVFNLNIRATKKYEFVHIPILLCVYNDSGLSATNSDILFTKNRLQLIKNTFPFHIYIYVYLRSMIKKMLYG